MDIVLQQPQRSEQEVANELVTAARKGESEDDITIVVVKIVFPDHRIDEE